MSDIWVCKFDGSIQCEDCKGLTLDEMTAQLAALIGRTNILTAETRQRMMPRLCGLPTGVQHAFEITPEGEYILFHGFVGPQGFAYCDGEGPEIQDTPSLSNIIQCAKIGSVSQQPVLVRELIGRQVRCYAQGDIITGDHVPGRVNVVTRNGKIIDIWIG